jgi:excisionase family DNA binding protein
MMTAKITVERISAHTVRMTLVADIQISGSLGAFAPHESASKAAGTGSSGTISAAGGSANEHELLSVEQTAEILNVGRDKVYYLMRTGQLRSIKIGKLRRISRVWIAEFVEGVAHPYDLG